MSRSITRSSGGVLVGAVVIAIASHAQAALTLYEKDGWTVTIGGRAQGFYSVASGDSAASVGQGVVLTGEQPVGSVGGPDGTFVTSRMRGGWAASMFGLTVTNQISDRLKVTGRLSFWFTIEGAQTKGENNDNGSLDIRQGFLKLEGPFGGLLLGRNLGLHSRGSLMQDSFITADEFGVGSPCSVTGLGITCGQVGYGVLMPGFNAGIVYNTPDWHGFLLSVGAYDPRAIPGDGLGNAGYGRTPLPRFESEALQHLDWRQGKVRLDLFVNGMWQRLGWNGDPRNDPMHPVELDPWGIGYGGKVGIGPVQLGFVGGHDKGGGMYVPLGDVSMDPTGTLRWVTTYWGQAMVSLGKIDLTGGVGTALMQSTPTDDADLSSSLIRSHVGINAAVMYHLGPVVLLAQYFQMRHTWQRGQRQVIDVVNLGGTFNW